MYHCQAIKDSRAQQYGGIGMILNFRVGWSIDKPKPFLVVASNGSVRTLKKNRAFSSSPERSIRTWSDKLVADVSRCEHQRWQSCIAKGW